MVCVSIQLAMGKTLCYTLMATIFVNALQIMGIFCLMEFALSVLLLPSVVNLLLKQDVKHAPIHKNSFIRGFSVVFVRLFHSQQGQLL